MFKQIAAGFIGLALLFPGMAIASPRLALDGEPSLTIQEYAFVDYVAEQLKVKYPNSQGYQGVALSLLPAGNTFCAARARGVTVNEFSTALVGRIYADSPNATRAERGVQIFIGGTVMGAAAGALCPQFSELP